MLDLAHRAAELLIERIERLPEEHAWEGEFRQELVAQLMEDPPESSQPAMQVIERAARDILPLAVRNVVDGEWDDDLMTQVQAPAPIPV